MDKDRPDLPHGLTPDEILRIARRHGAFDVRVFGSRARGDARSDSDLDLLVGLERGRDLFDLIGLKLDLEERAGIRVEVLTPGFLDSDMRPQVEQEAIAL